jgi:hypothetical protein
VVGVGKGNEFQVNEPGSFAFVFLSVHLCTSHA